MSDYLVPVFDLGGVFVDWDPMYLFRKLFETGEYPYAQRMRVGPYEEHMVALQRELLKAQRWIEEILAFEPGHQSERTAWLFCLTQLARKSGQRAIDIDDGRRRSVLTILNSQKVPSHWIRMVEEVLELEADDGLSRLVAGPA